MGSAPGRCSGADLYKRSVMRIHVKFHSRFREIFDCKERDVEIADGANVRDLLALLCTTEKQSSTIYAEVDKKLKHDVMITKNRMIIFHMKRLETQLSHNDEVAVLYPACMG